MLLPVAVVALLVTQAPALASPSNVQHDAGSHLLSQRPAPSNASPPPTLAPPAATATPVPPTPAPARAPADSPAPGSGDTYVVAPGDDLKTIAAKHNLSLARLIAANTIPDPDSLRVGQMLRIPANP